MSNGIIFDLKNFRTIHLKNMSQEAFAKQIGVSQDKVSRMEADPSQVSLEILINIATHFGISLDELIGLQKSAPEALNVDYTWGENDYIKKTLIKYILQNNVSASFKKDIDELNHLINKAIRKPKVAFIGRSDVGKSTMINSLLGSTKMPAHWTPTTAIAVYIKHVNDRPEYMDEDVWIFKSEAKTNETWDDTRLTDESYCRSLKLSSGNYDLLNTYGTRNGEHFSENLATSAVVFIDSPLLLNCDIVDLPGYGTGDRAEDDALSLREKSKADVIVYLSIANGFMRGEDISYVKDALPTLPDIQGIDPLANLFIVASQAHTVDNGNLTELTKILTAGCDRFEKSLSEGIWEDRQKPALLKDRFYTYTSNSSVLRERFEHDFALLIETLPKVLEERSKEVIREWRKNKDIIIQNAIDNYEQLLKDKEQCEKALKEYLAKEPTRQREFQNTRKSVISDISKYKAESIDEISNYYYNTINVDNLVSEMENRNVTKDKKDLEVFSSYVSSSLQDKTNSILKKKSEKVAKSINGFLTAFETNTVITVSNNTSLKLAPFSKEQAFAAGLTGIATYGALAAWAASCGNLGGYILVVKGVSLLSTLGISVGGTAAATSAVAAIGGPVVIGIALSILAAVTAFSIFSGGWKKSFAKKLVSSCSDERVLDKLRDSINTYWTDTEKAFNASADNLDKEWKHHLETLRTHLSSYDINSITLAKAEAEAMRNFLSNLPFME